MNKSKIAEVHARASLKSVGMVFRRFLLHIHTLPCTHCVLELCGTVLLFLFTHSPFEMSSKNEIFLEEVSTESTGSTCHFGPTEISHMESPLDHV